MQQQLLWTILTTASLGVFAKYADLFNDNGMREPFPGAALLSGLLWGVSGALQMLLSPFAGLTYVAHVLYWFLRVKLEQTNHAVAGVIMVISAMTLRAAFFAAHRWEFLAVFVGYTLSGYIHTWFKLNVPGSRTFLRLRFRIYGVPAIYSLYTGEWAPIVATISGMIPCEIITWYHRDLKDEAEERLLQQA